MTRFQSKCNGNRYYGNLPISMQMLSSIRFPYLFLHTPLNLYFPDTDEGYGSVGGEGGGGGGGTTLDGNTVTLTSSSSCRAKMSGAGFN